MAEKLTRRRIEAWPRRPGDGEWLLCGEVRGFGVQRRVNANGKGEAALVCQFRVGKGRLAKRRRVVIGRFPTLTPESARDSARDMINEGIKGGDPVAKQTARQIAAKRQRAATYESLSDAFWTERLKALRASSAAIHESVWQRLILRELGRLAVPESKCSDVATLLDTIAAEIGMSVADRAFVILGMFYSWYSRRDDEFRSPLIASMRRHTMGSGTRPMTDGELRKFWRALANG